MTESKLEWLCYLAGIIWIPIGIVGESAFVFGIGMMAIGIGMFATYIRRNSRVAYTEINLPRREDDTVEIKSYDSDNSNTK